MSEFDFNKYVTGNKLTLASRIETRRKKLLNEAAEEDDTWDTGEDEFDSSEFEKEPSKKDLKKADTSVASNSAKREKLAQLVRQKDALVDRLKKGELTIDQYKQEIGSIPQQIKTLTADLSTMTDLEDEEDETIAEDDDPQAETDMVDESLSDEAMVRMDGLVPQSDLRKMIFAVQTIIASLKEEGFEDDEIYDYVDLKIRTLDV